MNTGENTKHTFWEARAQLCKYNIYPTCLYTKWTPAKMQTKSQMGVPHSMNEPSSHQCAKS